jgi:ABC-type lipoprotein release transport system permease subunit
MATFFSFTFSISVILCTFGLMDGFDHLLKTGLRQSTGDVIITNKKGFFRADEVNNSVDNSQPLATASVIQTEAFALSNGLSQGVLVKGVDAPSFEAASGLSIKAGSNEIVIGEELAKIMNLKRGDSLALALGSGNESGNSLPSIRVFTVNDIIRHGIYQKDLRFVYLNRTDLAELMGVDDRINMMIVTYFPVDRAITDLEPIQMKATDLKMGLMSEYRVRPFWDEYGFLIEAVKVEKFSISLILQLIVVVAVFNIIAFVIFVMEKKAQDFFFLRAVGLSLHDLMGFWLKSILILWALSCVGAWILSHLFNWSLKTLPFFKVPGQIYVLSELSIRLDSVAYVQVYAISLVWVLIAAGIAYFRLRNRPIIQGLRQEFN